jgi:hypothetical protein
MDRFPLESATDLAANYARHMALKVCGDDAIYSAAVNVCENCGRACETLHHVPEFDYMGCDDCLAEAMAEIVRERSEGLAAARIGETRGKAA